MHHLTPVVHTGKRKSLKSCQTVVEENQISSKPSSSSASLRSAGGVLIAFCFGDLLPFLNVVVSPSPSRTSYSPRTIFSVCSETHFFSAFSTRPSSPTFLPCSFGDGPVLSKEYRVSASAMVIAEESLRVFGTRSRRDRESDSSWASKCASEERATRPPDRPRSQVWDWL